MPGWLKLTFFSAGAPFLFHIQFCHQSKTITIIDVISPILKIYMGSVCTSSKKKKAKMFININNNPSINLIPTSGNKRKVSISLAQEEIKYRDLNSKS